MIIRLSMKRGNNTAILHINNSKELFNILVMNGVTDDSPESLALSSYWYKELENDELVFASIDLIEKINNPKFEELYD